MAHRAHLFSLRPAHALLTALQEAPYGASKFSKDLIAGITVGIIAIPLAMALAIACGVAPQYGLYSAIIAGFLVPLTGGSRYSVSGPTAAFVVILYPVVQQYGLAGLLLASIMAGVILVFMALLRLGRYIEYIPASVTLGFTGGIAVVIATLQVKDFLGLALAEMPSHFTGKVVALLAAIPDFSPWSLGVGLVTLAVLLLWPRLKTPLPAHLPAVVIGSLVALLFNQEGQQVATIGSTFSFMLPDGTTGSGIPALLPDLQWPWLRSQPGEAALTFSWPLVQDLLSAAFAIAMLGAIESLLCAVVLDGMSGKKHSANSELLGQGIGNIIAPLFGGITSTAAIARSAANLKAGAQTPVAAMLHAVMVLLALLFLSRLLAYLPMPSMAALLFVVAWNMSEAPKALHLLRTAPRSDIFVFMVCFTLTILFDMVVAITAGIVLASLLFMQEIAEMTIVRDITENKNVRSANVPSGWKVYKINGPLFFAAADRVFGELSLLCDHQQGIVVYLDGVSILDSGGVAALNKFIEHCSESNTQLYLADFQYQPLRTLAKAGFKPDNVTVSIYSTMAEALLNLPSKKEEGSRSDPNIPV